MTHDSLTIEQKKFDVFMDKFKNGEFGSQRLGQAFYNEFKLHRINDQTKLNNLYAKDGKHAVNPIRAIFVFN